MQLSQLYWFHKLSQIHYEGGGIYIIGPLLKERSLVQQRSAPRWERTLPSVAVRSSRKGSALEAATKRESQSEFVS